MQITDLIRGIVFRFGAKIPQLLFDQILVMFSGTLESLKKDTSYVRITLETFTSLVDNYPPNQSRWLPELFTIFHEIFKEIHKYQFPLYDYFLIQAECLRYFGALCKTNNNLIYNIRFELIDYLSTFTQKSDELIEAEGDYESLGGEYEAQKHSALFLIE